MSSDPVTGDQTAEASRVSTASGHSGDMRHDRDDITARVDAAVAESTATDHQSLQQIISELEAQLITFRRDIHQHPELSWQEHRTTDQIAAALRDVGLEPVQIGRAHV